MNTPETKEIFQLYRMGVAMTWELEPLVAAIEIRRDEAEKQLRELVEVCNEYGGGANVSHPRYTRKLFAAKKFFQRTVN